MKKIFCFALMLAIFLVAGCNSAAIDSKNMTDKGVKAYEDGKLEVASQSLLNAIQRDPNNDLALYWMARIDMDYHDYQAAIPRLNEAAGIYPTQPLYWFTLAQANALQAEQQFLANDKNSAMISYGECVKSANKASKLDPFYAEAQLQAARCHVGAEEYSEAVDAYAESIKSNPVMKSPQGVTEHYVELGKLYSRFGFHSEAQEVLENGLMHNAGDGQMESALADVLLEMKNYDEALAHYEAANKFLDLNGESKLRALDALFGTASVYLAQANIEKEKGQIREYYEKLEEAKNWFERYAENANADTEVMRRADAHAKISDIQSTLDELDN